MQESQGERAAATERMKAYISAHLKEAFTAKALANAAGYSQYYAARLFKEETGLSPFEYIRRERLIGSAHSLRQGKNKVLDVALDFVFDSHEGFTRAFSNAFGINPKRYAGCPNPEGWLIPYRYLNRSKSKQGDINMATSAVIFTQIIQRPERKLILKRGVNADDYFSYCEETGCGKGDDSAAWDVLSEIKGALYEPVGLWLPENMRPTGTSIYAHGVEVPADYCGEIPAGFDVIDLPACDLIVFQGEPYDDKDFSASIGLCMEGIEKFNPEVYGYSYAPELSPKMQLKPWGWRGYIEMQPVKRII